MPENTTPKKPMQEILNSIETGIKELFASEKYAVYLRTMSKFHHYSVNNQMLIYMQRPDATLVAGYDKWQKQFGRNVKKGEKSIRIIAPTPYKKKIEQDKLDPDTKLPMRDADGNIIKEEKEIKIPMYKPVPVFDVAQTDGKPLPQLASDLTGNVQNYDVFLESLKRASPVPIAFEPLEVSTDGYFVPSEHRIAIRDGMSEVQTVSAVLHEIAHAKLHDYEKFREADGFVNDNAEPIKPKDRRTKEVEAESISYAVCQHYGIETGDNSFGYIAQWSKDKELKVLKESLETISKTSSSLITDIDRHYRDVCKERGITAEKAQDIENDVAEPQNTVPQTQDRTLPDPTVPVEAMQTFGYTDPEMLPLSKDRALELLAQDVTVYMLYGDNTESMAFEPEDIHSHAGLFGIERSEWEKICDKIPPMTVKDNPLKNTEMQMEDDYGMIDGIVNNGKRETEPPKAKSAPEQRISIHERLEQLKSKEQPQKTKTMRKSAERDAL